LNAGCSIRVCGKEGELNVVNTDTYGTENWEKRFFRQENHKLCEEIWERKAHIARPGDSERDKETFKGNTDGPQELPRVEFTRSSNGMYSLSASFELTIDGDYNSEKIEHHACDNREVKTVIQSAPNMMPHTSSDEEGNTIMSGPSVPVVRPLLLVANRIGMQGTNKTIYERVDKDNGYHEKATASWNLQRTRTSCDCVVFLDMAKGDVKVNGKPPDSTLLDDPKQISTGAKSRAGFTLGNGDRIRIGSNNTVDIRTACRSKGAQRGSITMNIRSIITILTAGSGYASFHCTNSNAHDGVRGEVLPIPGPFHPNIRFASYRQGPLAFSTVSFDEDRFSEVMPSPQDIGRASAGLLIEPHHSSFNIWVLKGKFKVKANTGFSATLEGLRATAVGQMPAPCHIEGKWLDIQVSE
jgi:hypothetical protein